jgi:hypothetical protein
MDKALEVAKEIERIALEHNISLQDLIEQYKKAHSPATKQGNEPNTKTTSCIIADTEDIDNGEIYDIGTGVTIRRLEDECI